MKQITYYRGDDGPVVFRLWYIFEMRKQPRNGSWMSRGTPGVSRDKKGGYMLERERESTLAHDAISGPFLEIIYELHPYAVDFGFLSIERKHRPCHESGGEEPGDKHMCTRRERSEAAFAPAIHCA